MPSIADRTFSGEAPEGFKPADPTPAPVPRPTPPEPTNHLQGFLRCPMPAISMPRDPQRVAMFSVNGKVPQTSIYLPSLVPYRGGNGS